MRKLLVKAYTQLALACIEKEITFDEFRSVIAPLEAITTKEELAAARYQIEAVRTARNPF